MKNIIKLQKRKYDKEYHLKLTARDLRKRINKSIKILQKTSVDMPNTILIETINCAIHTLRGGSL